MGIEMVPAILAVGTIRTDPKIHYGNRQIGYSAGCAEGVYGFRSAINN